MISWLGPPSYLFTLCVISLCLSDCQAIQEIYMFDYCDITTLIRVEKSLMLHFARPDTLPDKRREETHSGLHCGLSVSSKDRTNRLLLHIVSLHIDMNHADRLQIFEESGRRFHRLSPGPGIYGKYGGVVQISSDGIKDYKTHGDTFYIDYKGFPTKEWSGFSLLFTEFHSDPSRTGSCRGVSFHCEHSNICIDSALTCDNYRNCGEYDNSDESSCYHGIVTDNKETEQEDSTLTIGLSVGIVATLTFLLVSLAIFLVTKLRRRHLNSARVLSETTSGDFSPETRTEARESELNLASLYAPPSYEDVMLTSTSNLALENPPPYDSLVSLNTDEISPSIRRLGRGRVAELSRASSPSISVSTSDITSRASSLVDVNKDEDTPIPLSMNQNSDNVPANNTGSMQLTNPSHINNSSEI